MKSQLWLLALCLSVCSCSKEAPAAPDYRWETDGRLRAVLSVQAPKGHFDLDTGDMLPRMVEKLSTGQRDVQNHFRGELARGGPRAVRLIDDFIHRHASSRTGTLMIGNALGVLGLSEEPSAVTVIRKMLGHPSESVRSAAIRAMVKQARPEDYAVLTSLMPTVGGELRRVLVLAMGNSDSSRLAGDLSDWVRDGGESALSVLAARAVAAANAGGSLDEGILAHSAAGDPSLNPYLTSALAATGDVEARAALLSDLSDEDLLVRTRALEAAAMSGLEDVLLTLVTDDPSVTLRVLASEAVAKLLPDGRAQSALKQGLRDQSPVVRQACMRGLLLAGDPEVADVFIGALRSDLSELGPVFRAVRGCWDNYPRLADQAAGVLITLLDGMSSRAISEREPWLQALGQVPSTLGSAWLIALADRTDGEVHNMPVHRWLFLQVSNGGSKCRSSLADAYYKETSIERRFDLVWAASFSAEEDTRAFLMDVVLREDSLDHERLYAADRLTKLGPTPVVAPVLKRACVRIRDAKVRPAFESLLWTWYG